MNDIEKTAAIYEKHKNVMYATAIKILKDPFLAEDAVHDAILAVMKHLDAVSDVEDRSCAYYVITATRHISLNTAENVFIAWKHLNNIQNDVRLIKCEIESNGVDSYSDYAGEDVANHKQGDYFVLNITISSEIQKYGTERDYNSIIQTLKQTMSGYSNIDFDEVNVFIE